MDQSFIDADLLLMNTSNLDDPEFFYPLDDVYNASHSNHAINGTGFNESINDEVDFFSAGPTFLILQDDGPSEYPSPAPSVQPTWPPPPNATDTSVGLIESTDTAVLINTIQVYGIIYLIGMALFCVLRLRYNKLFNIRSWVPGLQCKIAMESDYGLVNWMWKVFEVEEDDILEQCGLDALCFIRVLKLGRRLALVGCIHALWLIPVYATAEDSDETWYLTDPLVLISTAHLPIGSPRFLATIVCAYTVFGYAMWLMKRELQWFIEMRHKFVSQRRPRNYAVYVSGIPEELRRDARLAEFFRQSGATSSVLEAHVTMACPELEGLVAQREYFSARLKHAQAFEEIYGERKVLRRVNLPNMKTKGSGAKRSSLQNHSNGLVATYDSIDTLETKLRQLTKDIALAFQNIERSNDPYTLEQHREQVIGEIEELRNAERAQNVANRERVHSFHGEEEEIFHVPSEELEATNSKYQQRGRSDDRFSRAAEAFFLGSLSPRGREERQMLLDQQGRQHSGSSDDDPLRRVTIQTSSNSLYSDTLSEASEEEMDLDGYYRHERPTSPSSRPEMADNTFPSRSTITTVPGTFDNTKKKRSSRFWNYSNRHEKKNNVKSIEILQVPSNDTASSGRNEEAYSAIRTLVRMNGEQYDSEEDGEQEDSQPGGSGDSLGQSKSSNALRIVSKGVHKLSGGVGKTVANVGSGVGEVTKQSLKVAAVAGDFGITNIQKVGEFGVKEANKAVWQAAELGVANIYTIRASAAAVVPMVMAHGEGKPLEAGFVVFKDLYSTQAALQMLHHNEAGSMVVEEAPGPEEIYWRNVGLPGSAQRTGRLLSLAATVALCLFWTVPVSFVSALTEVNSLKEQIPSLAESLEKHPGLEGMLALIAPLLLLILQDVALPVFLMWFATWEGHVSRSAMEAAVFLKYASFVLVQTFFISAMAGSISAELANMLNEPDQFIDFLANALPAQSNYFLQILVVAMAVTMGLELLRVAPLALAFVRRFVGPNLTEEERTKRWKFLSPLEDPREFEHANVSGSVVLYFMVFFVYACLAPISSFFLFGMFLLMESGYRYQFMHNYPPTPDSGGKHWIGFFHILQACMIVAQLTLVGFLVLKRSFFGIPFMTPLLGFTILFIYYLNTYQLRVAKYLPTGQCIAIDKVNRVSDFDFVKGGYLQPCLREAISDDIFELLH
ncbi:CSC1-like protein [Seminavis robusta]|uniref:CSC1-like protein n=1 Tax=Seminavis robusta TaxID=568900 RepID=A0A9N8H6J6_9STRA|nr:CSC1-like protein [Seminavis robusta]|eukprot:Sro149_g068400.1 CSC1-like protein (1182) ;mRNA; r:33975-37815